MTPELGVEGRDALVEGTPLAAQVFSQLAVTRAESLALLFIGEDREFLLQLAAALRRHDRKLHVGSDRTLTAEPTLSPALPVAQPVPQLPAA